jgi:hypothetical protein
MKKINDQVLNQMITESVRKHLKEVDDMKGENQDPRGLLAEYLLTAEKFVNKIRKLLDHPDIKFIIDEDEEMMILAKAGLGNFHELYLKLREETGSGAMKKPKVETPPKYDEKDFKDTKYPEPSAAQLNERKKAG